MATVLAATDRDVRSAYLDLIRDLIRYGVDELVPQQWPLRRALLKAGLSVPGFIHVEDDAEQLAARYQTTTSVRE